MINEEALRERLHDLADQAGPAHDLATTALRRAHRRHRRVMMAVASGAALALSVPLAALGGWDPGITTETGAGGPASQPTEAAPQIMPAPAVLDLTEAEVADAFAVCRREFDAYAEWMPVFGVTIDAEAAPGVPTTWVAARRGDEWRADCSLDSTGQQVGGGGEYGLKSTPDLLYALVDGQEGQGAGRYVDPVVRVTVQSENEPEQDAVLRGGFWFSSIDSRSRASVDHGDDPEEAGTVLDDDTMIGVPSGYIFRGYDASNERVYDSSQDGPTIEDCYADPTGTEFVGNYAGRDDPAGCVRTHEWQPRGV
ncbi:MAG: hypothetical protein ACRDWI_08810 [Jiangellaceae bacterium]